jgi:hypothetical protein
VTAKQIRVVTRLQREAARRHGTINTFWLREFPETRNVSLVISAGTVNWASSPVISSWLIGPRGGIK